MYKQGLFIRSESGVNILVRKSCLEFAKWLRSNNDFPVKVVVYLKKDKRIICKSKELAYGTCLSPFGKNKNICIKVATGDFYDNRERKDEYYALMLILETMAHEIIHYFQWINNNEFNERQIRKKSKSLVVNYSDYKEDCLFYSRKQIDILTKGDIYYKSGSYEKCIMYFNQLIKLNLYDDIAYQNKGKALLELEKYNEAINCFNKAIELNPSLYQNYINKGYALDMLKRFDESILCYDIAININASDDTVYNNKGYALNKLKRYDKALDCYNKAIELNPDNHNYLIFKNMVFKKIKNN